MKTTICIIAIIATTFLYTSATAQKNACVWCGMNMELQPAWGPTGYEHVDNYYIPAIDAYYNVSQQLFTYRLQGNWVTTAGLPARYAGFNLYSAHKVVLNEDEPYLRNQINKTEFATVISQHNQPSIRDSRDERYSDLKQHTGNNKVQTALAQAQALEDAKAYAAR